MFKRLVLMGMVMMMWGWGVEVYGERYVQNDSSWHWLDKDSTRHTRTELDTIIARHERWMGQVKSVADIYKIGINRIYTLITNDDKRRKIAGDKKRKAVDELAASPNRIFLVGANLTKLNLRENTDLSGSILRKVVLDSTVLNNIILKNADFRKSSFRHAMLKSTNLKYTRMDEAVLDEVSLEGSILEETDFSKASLINATLSYSMMLSTILNYADISGISTVGARIREIKLVGCDLRNVEIAIEDSTVASFQGAVISNRDFNGLKINSVPLKDAKVENVSFRSAYLQNCNMYNASFFNVDFSEAHLDSAVLTEATLVNSKFIGTSLINAKCTGAKFNNITLIGCILIDANLEDSELLGANLSRADITGAYLDGTALSWANLNGVVFEPGTLPNPQDIAYARGLDRLTYDYNPAKLAELKKLLLDVGYRNASKQVNAALKRKDANILEKVFFDLPCEYGSNYWRPITALLVCFVISFAIYFLFMVSGFAFLGIQVPRKYIISRKKGFKKDIKENCIKWIKVNSKNKMLEVALWFSLQRTFRLGFRDFSPNHWLKMLLPPEFDIKSRGIVRVYSAFQSIISVYLIVMMLVSYFGRLFD